MSTAVTSSAYAPPLNPTVAAAVEKLPEGAREAFEERAAIMEHDGGLPRADAEREALSIVLAG